MARSTRAWNSGVRRGPPEGRGESSASSSPADAAPPRPRIATPASRSPARMPPWYPAPRRASPRGLMEATAHHRGHREHRGHRDGTPDGGGVAPLGTPLAPPTPPPSGGCSPPPFQGLRPLSVTSVSFVSSVVSR